MPAACPTCITIHLAPLQSENESSSEEEGDAWDPSTATPFAKGRKKGAQGEGAQRRRSTGARRRWGHPP